MIKVVFATGSKGEFGNNGELPWGEPIKEDMDHFKEFTKDCILVMGRKTFESLPCKLPNREHFVISSKKCFTKRGESPDKQLRYCQEYNYQVLENIASFYNKPFCIIGGASLINKVVEYADEVMYTHVHKEFKADTYVDSVKLALLLQEKPEETNAYSTREGFINVIKFKREK